MPIENPTTTIEVKFRGDGGEPYTGSERRDQRRDKGWDENLCGKRVLTKISQPALTAIADGMSFAVNFKQQPTGTEGDSKDFRRRIIKGACTAVGALVSKTMEAVYLESTQSSEGSQS